MAAVKSIGHHCTVRDLAERVGVVERHALVMVRELERRGWLDCMDLRRPMWLSLTLAGQSLVVLAAVHAFAAEMREQDIHVGIGHNPRCVVCDVPYPCAYAKPARDCSDDAPVDEFSEAQLRTLEALSDGDWHKGNRTGGPGAVLGVPAAALVRRGLVRRRGESRWAKPSAPGYQYQLTAEGRAAARRVLDA